jgi:predicted transcriptional regulator
MEEIINFLKEGEKSSSEIASHINKNYYDTLKILDDLEKKGILLKMELGRYTYWKLNKEEKGNGKSSK